MAYSALVCAVLLSFVPRTAMAQVDEAARITWSPERPVQGTLFRVYVNARPDNHVSGTAAGEQLHFVERNGRWEALAAAPLDQGSAVVVFVQIAHADIVGSESARIPIGKGVYALEKLKVAPQFGTPPDAELQARIDREREKALAVSRASHGTPRLWEEIVRPRTSRITSGFGSGREFNGKVQSRHTGTDFAGAVGSPVRAAARGVVALVDTFYLAGRVVYIDHGEGLVSAYFHLSRHDVAPGDTVTAGQQIGLVGATGRV
ncbi:MAG TPA: M23 family metallopeptidase, partial [Longimicrobiales bacterium]